MGIQINRSSKEPMSEINVTPFVDVMLVLLIIFMVTAPLLTVGVQVDLPESSADSLPEEQEPLTLTIILKVKFLFKNQRLNLKKLLQKYWQFQKTEQILEFMLEVINQLIMVEY